MIKGKKKGGYAARQTTEGRRNREKRWKGGGAGIESKRRRGGGVASLFALMQDDSQRHADLTQRSQTHRSFLSLTFDRRSPHPSGPLCCITPLPLLCLSTMEGLQTGLNRGRFDRGAEGVGGGI